MGAMRSALEFKPARLLGVGAEEEGRPAGAGWSPASPPAPPALRTAERSLEDQNLGTLS